MIGYIKGIIAEITEELLVLESNQIGYNIRISASTAQALPGILQPVKIYTYTCVREDAISLYGFLTKEDLDFFKLLITVNGIGPKGAQCILAVMSPDDLRFAIVAGDSKTISKAPGIGPKTAQRVILDLKDKVSLSDVLQKGTDSNFISEITPGNQDGVRNEALEALVALGYSSSDALRAIRGIDIVPDMSTEDILKSALRNMVFV